MSGSGEGGGSGRNSVLGSEAEATSLALCTGLGTLLAVTHWERRRWRVCAACGGEMAWLRRLDSTTCSDRCRKRLQRANGLAPHSAAVSPDEPRKSAGRGVVLPASPADASPMQER
jgi:hypothetical protein